MLFLRIRKKDFLNNQITFYSIWIVHNLRIQCSFASLTANQEQYAGVETDTV